jgi:hypothetical protein
MVKYENMDIFGKESYKLTITPIVSSFEVDSSAVHLPSLPAAFCAVVSNLPCPAIVPFAANLLLPCSLALRGVFCSP